MARFFEENAMGKMDNLIETRPSAMRIPVEAYVLPERSPAIGGLPWPPRASHMRATPKMSGRHEVGR
jgi:hypothetical protein